MAQSTNNLILAGFSGNLGDIVIKNYKGKIVLCKKSDRSRVVPSELQNQTTSRFALAVARAKALIADPVKKAELEKSLNLDNQHTMPH